MDGAKTVVQPECSGFFTEEGAAEVINYRGGSGGSGKCDLILPV